MSNALYRELMEIGEDILSSERFAKARKVPHHNKDVNIAVHGIETAAYALLFARWLNRHGISVSEEDVVRAGLLHDVGMTEDKVFFSPSPIKGYTHPRKGVSIAREEFGANDVQVDAILRHMWPFCNLLPPRSVEGWVVSAADKWCSINEIRRFLSRSQYTKDHGTKPYDDA